ncbi:MAG: carbohydrate ABC transporter permease [Lachnospiraceae bacterium]|jgi:multiple sugar transport system permease protein|nr:carbohydrate ABC transporter permease [Lachnospiraceae bacterium]
MNAKAKTHVKAEKKANTKAKIKIKQKHNLKWWRNTAAKGAIYFVLICVGFVYLEPIFEMIAKTFMSSADIIDPSVTWIPKNLSLNNLQVAGTVLKVGPTLRNTILWSGGMALAQTLVSALTGYALSRYEFKFKKFWFVMIVLAFIIPTPVTMIPRLMMFVSVQDATALQLIGTAIPQTSMALLGQGVYSTVLILIFYTAFNMIPRVLDEAAQIDGASSLKIFWFIVVKMSATTLLVVFLFSFVWNWNETYVTGTLLRGNIELLPSKLNMFNSEFSTMVSAQGGAFKLNKAYKMAATLISIMPLLLLYVFVQKQFIQGIENTGITGE